MPECPQCGSRNSRKSKRRASRRETKDPHIAAFRCHDCGTRFLAKDSSAIAQRVALAASAGLLLVAGIYSVVFNATPDASVQRRAASPEQADVQSLQSVAYDAEINTDELKSKAEEGDSQAQYQLAMSLATNYEKTNDLSVQFESVRWLGEAAGNGHALAQTEMGNRYLNGRGVVQNFDLAADWYRKAAEKGNPEAMYGLGNMARSGWDEELSLTEAYAWLNVASARGEKRADEARDQVLARLSTDELKEAQQMSRKLDLIIPTFVATNMP